MVITTTILDISSVLSRLNAKKARIGFVPTMGALHEGHLSLIQTSIAECDYTVCSIFVNPTQFNDPNDFEKYPVQHEKDIEVLKNNGCDVLFLPSKKEIYPSSTDAYIPPDIGNIATILEGKHRPGHFTGVMQVVERLLEIVTPTTLFLGQKDYQQCLVLSRMVQARKIPVNIHIVPTVREEDGLAMSSRNVRLSSSGRKKATLLYQTLKKVSHLIKETSIEVLHQMVSAQFREIEGVELEYFSIRSANTLLHPQKASSRKKESFVALIVAYVEGVRLIDNMLL